MSVSLQVHAIRDVSSEVEPMLKVLAACTMAGVSYPPELINFFGDAWNECGPDPERLKAAMESVQLPVVGDPTTADGASISLANLPDGTTALRIKAVADTQPSLDPPIPVAMPIADPVLADEPFAAEPAEPMLDEPLSFSDSFPPSMAPEIEERLVDENDEPLDLDEPTDIIPQEVARALNDEVVEMFDEPTSAMSIDLDEPAEVIDPAPAVEEVRREEKQVIDLDQADNFVLDVEDDLLDIDDLDDPLELDEPAERT